MIGSIGAGGVSANLVKGIPEEPSIAMPKVTKAKMEFDTDRTSSHWYNEESKQSEAAEAGTKKKGG